MSASIQPYFRGKWYRVPAVHIRVNLRKDVAPIQGAIGFATFSNPGRCPGLRCSSPLGSEASRLTCPAVALWRRRKGGNIMARRESPGQNHETGKYSHPEGVQHRLLDRVSPLRLTRPRRAGRHGRMLDTGIQIYHTYAYENDTQHLSLIHI